MNCDELDLAVKVRFQESLQRLLIESSIVVADIEQLLDYVLVFLDAVKMPVAVTQFITCYGELGQLLSLLSHDDHYRVLVTGRRGPYKKLLKCITWFYRQNPKDDVEQKVSHWALSLMMKAISARQLRNPIGCSVLPAVPMHSFMRIFQNCLQNFAGSLKPNNLERRVPWLVRTSSLLLQQPDQNPALIELLIDVLPPSRLDDTGKFFDELAAKINVGISDDNSYPPYLFGKLARKHPLILENTVVRLLIKWTTLWPSIDSDADDFQWLIPLIADDAKIFQQLIFMLHSALESLNYHEAILHLIQQLLREIKKIRKTSLFNLYPENLLFLVYLLDTDTGLPGESQIQHCVYILDAVLGGVGTGDVTVDNVKMLLSHFPTWYTENLKRIIFPANDMVRSKVLLLVSLLTGDSILKVMRNLTDYFD